MKDINVSIFFCPETNSKICYLKKHFSEIPHFSCIVKFDFYKWLYVNYCPKFGGPKSLYGSGFYL